MLFTIPQPRTRRPTSNKHNGIRMYKHTCIHTYTTPCRQTTKYDTERQVPFDCLVVETHRQTDSVSFVIALPIAAGFTHSPKFPKKFFSVFIPQPHTTTNMAEKPVQPMFQLTDKVAVITGGTGTLGSCMALGLAQAGATVVVLGRNATSGEKVVARITEAGGNASFIACDVLVEADLKAANEKILTDLKKVCMRRSFIWSCVCCSRVVDIAVLSVGRSTCW